MQNIIEAPRYTTNSIQTDGPKKEGQLNQLDFSDRKRDSSKSALDNNLRVDTSSMRHRSDLNLNQQKKQVFEMRIQSEDSLSIVSSEVDVTPGFRIQE